MPLWKFIWLRPLLFASVTSVIGAIFLDSNAETSGEEAKRVAIGFIGLYILFVVCAAVEWWFATPLKADDEAS